MKDELAHYAVDAGSIQENRLAWVRNGSPPSRDIDDLAGALRNDLENGVRATLGYECPLYWLFPNTKARLGRSRKGEEKRSSLAGAGATITPTGVQALAYIFQKLADLLKTGDVCFDWDHFKAGGGRLFVWEAYGAEKEGELDDGEDAECVAKTFRAWNEEQKGVQIGQGDNPFSLVGSVLLWAGIEDASAVTRQACLMLKVDYTGVKFTKKEKKSKAKKKTSSKRKTAKISGNAK